MSMQLHTLPGTAVATSPLGLGCAGLYRLAHRADRDAVMTAALDAGVRHFDTAPMYGLGRAEADLAPILRSRRDELTVTTKFGTDPSALGRAIGRIQGPGRALLARRAGLQRKARESGANSSSGSIGRLLYTAHGYTATSAARALHRSLRALGTDYIDVFALHDPMGAVITDVPDLVAYLDGEVRAGTIRCWGVAGAAPTAGPDTDHLLASAAVVQQHDDIFDDAQRIAANKAVITFGCLSRALPALLGHLADHPDAGPRWTERLGTDVTDSSALAEVLLREATRRNPRGVVLFSTTRPQRVTAAVRTLEGLQDPAQLLALNAIADEIAASKLLRERSA
jgi:D-threo-aldose 1-dehydrogenase